jgi:hypothetical protein
MIEAGLSGAILLVVYAASQAYARLHAPLWGMGGLACLVLGTLGSLVTGVGYHVALYRALRPTGVLQPGWWWSPARLHPHLSAKERRQVLPWFYAGAASFVLVVLGALVFAVVALAF